MQNCNMMNLPNGNVSKSLSPSPPHETTILTLSIEHNDHTNKLSNMSIIDSIC